MGNQLEKWRKGKKSLVTGSADRSERQRMNEALGRLQQAEWKRNVDRPSGRLIFGLDLTGSREPGLHHARIATAAMFDTIRAIGAVQVKLIYFRGNRECRASAWHNDPAVVSRSMLALSCESGETQIARFLRAALAEEKQISGVVFVGDHCEDNPTELRNLAQTFGERSTPLFIFHECADDDERSLEAKPVFKRMAEASGGVYVEFRPDSGVVLREMLSNVGALAAAGREGVRQVPLPTTLEARRLQERLLLLPPGPSKQGR